MTPDMSDSELVEEILSWVEPLKRDEPDSLDWLISELVRRFEEACE